MLSIVAPVSGAATMPPHELPIDRNDYALQENCSARYSTCFQPHPKSNRGISLGQHPYEEVLPR